MSASTESDIEATINPVTAHRLFTFGWVALAAAIIASVWSSPIDDPVQLVSGVAIMVLSCAPGLVWARQSRPWFPCFEIYCLTCVVFYAAPLIRHSSDLDAYSQSVLTISGLLIVAYLVAAIVGFNFVRNPRRAPNWAVQRLLPDSMLRYMPAGIILNTVYLYLERFGSPIPPDIEGTIRALCFGLGIVTAFVMSCHWGKGTLTRQLKTLFVVCLSLQIIILTSQLYLIRSISLLILCAIGYTTTRRSLPWITIACLLPLIAVLHNGKTEMRKIYWTDLQPLPSVSEVPAFFAKWIKIGLEKKEGPGQSSLAAKLAERASLFQMLCLSVDQIPDRRPHLNGESYIDIPAQVIPRFLWPEKPSSLLSNVRLAVYFNLVDPDNPYTTSIAFGVISESYINFGILGVVALGFVTGLGFKHIALRSVGAPLFSAIGIFMILLTAWSFQAELVMATWLTSLFQASVISIIIPLSYKKLVGDV